MRQLSRQQLIVLAIFAIWALLLAVGLWGGSVVGLPRAVTAPAGTVALIALFWFMPGGYLYVLVLERRRGAIRTKGLGALAVRRRWYFGFVSALTLFAGLVLLLPSPGVTTELRIGGAVIFVFGLIAVNGHFKVRSFGQLKVRTL